MADMMTFPHTVDEFMEQYNITDTEHIYTNGTDLVPIFRMKQWFEHAADVREVKRGKWVDMGDFEQCSECKGTHLKEFQSYYGKTIWVKTNYCPNCGARMDGDENV